MRDGFRWGMEPAYVTTGYLLNTATREGNGVHGDGQLSIKYCIATGMTGINVMFLASHNLLL